VVHFNNLRLSEKARGAVRGTSCWRVSGCTSRWKRGSERVASAGGQVDPVECNTVDGGMEDEVIEVKATEEFFW